MWEKYVSSNSSIQEALYMSGKDRDIAWELETLN